MQNTESNKKKELGGNKDCLFTVAETPQNPNPKTKTRTSEKEDNACRKKQKVL